MGGKSSGTMTARVWDWRNESTPNTTQVPGRIIRANHHKGIDVKARLRDLQEGVPYSELARRWGFTYGYSAITWCRANEALIVEHGITLPAYTTSALKEERRHERVKTPYTARGLSEEWSVSIAAAYRWLKSRGYPRRQR